MIHESSYKARNDARPSLQSSGTDDERSDRALLRVTMFSACHCLKGYPQPVKEVCSSKHRGFLLNVWRHRLTC